MFKIKNVILAGVLSVCILSSAAERHEAKIKAVKNGTIKEADAAWWGFDKNDATRTLQQAINSGAKKVIVSNTGSDWIVSPITLRSNLELVFADGVTVRAKKGAFKRLHDKLFTAKGADNIIIRGEGKAVLMMNKKDYQNKANYKHSEWRNILSFLGCKNITITNITLKSSGGDGLYFSYGAGRPACYNIVIDNVRALDNHRQGMSVISAENLLIKNSTFSNTDGTPPNSGIDFEPNLANNILKNCVIENCIFNGNVGAGILMALNHLSKANNVSIKVRNVQMLNNKGAALIISMPADGENILKGKISIENAKVNNFISLANIVESGIEVSLKNIEIINKSAEHSPIIISSQISNYPVAMNFKNVVIKENACKKAFSLTSSGLLKPKLKGVINNAGRKIDMAKWSKAFKPDPAGFAKNYKKANLDMDAFAVSKHVSVKRPKMVQKWIRNRFDFLQYAKKGEKIKIVIYAKPVGRGHIFGNAKLYAPDGTEMQKWNIRKPANALVFTAPKTGLYKLVAHSMSTSVFSILSKRPGQGIVAHKLSFFATSGSLFFEVPKNATNFSIKVSGHPREPLDAEIFDSNGVSVAKVKGAQTPRYLHCTHIPSRKNEIWELKFKATEDCYIELGQPLNPLISDFADGLLRLKD